MTQAQAYSVTADILAIAMEQQEVNSYVLSKMDKLHLLKWKIKSIKSIIGEDYFLNLQNYFTNKDLK